MRVHANAPLGPKGRETMVLRVLEQGWSRTEAAEAAGVSERTCSKWVRRYRADGNAGLLDRPSAPRSIPHRTPDELVAIIVLLRKLRMTAGEIAFCLAIALSTVSAVLLRVGLGKLSRLEPPEPPNRYERRHAGELLHDDVKKLGRIADGRAGHRVHGNRRLQLSPRRRDAPAATASSSAGNTSTSASMTPPAWPTSKSSPTRRPPPRSASCNEPSLSTPATASVSGP